MKQFVISLNKDVNKCFRCICTKFPGSIIGKLNDVIFDGLQIRKLINDNSNQTSMNEEGLSAWSTFAEAVKTFLGNRKVFNYK